MALLWATHQRLNQKLIPFWCLGLLLIAWGLTQSRGSLASMILVVVLYLVIHMKEVENRLARWGTSQWIAFAAIALLLAVSVSAMINRLLMGENADPRSYFRIDVWISSFQMVKAQPLFGFGPGTYADIYPYYRPVGFWNTYNPFAHNEFLQVAAECGLPALTLTLLLIWTLVKEFLPSLFKTPSFKSSTASLQSAEFAFYLILFETVHNMVDFTFHEWSHRLVVLGFVTFALKEKNKDEDLKVDFRFSKRSIGRVSF